MRVIHVSPRYFPNVGGIEIVVKKMCESLLKRDVEVSVFSIDRCDGLAPKDCVEGVSVRRFAPLIGDPLYLPEPRFASALRDDSADIIHVHNIHTLPPLIVAACRRSNQKVLLQSHYHRYGQTPFRHSLLQLFKRGAGSILFSRSNMVMTNSVYEQKIFREDFPNARNVFLIPEGIDFNDAVRVKRELVEPKRILYVGVLKRYKNVDKLLEAFAYLQQSGNRNCKLVVVGRGAEFASLLSLATSLGIRDSVEWKQHLSRTDLLGEYARASVLVMLSPLESFSRVVYDALIIGVPVVVLNFGTFHPLVAAGYAEGVNLLSRESIAEAIVKATVKNYFRFSLSSGWFLDWESYSDRIFDVYKRLIES
jgi:glycosyltransferase involved in cell wall biosynthesis